MPRILILYGTGEGQTRKVANRIAEVARGRGHEVEIIKGNKASSDFSPKGFDAAIIGTSIHMGLHQISVKKLVKASKDGFSNMPCAYFCVCLTAISDKPQDKMQVEKYINDFKGYTGLQPVLTAVFAGALRYPYYNFIKRFIVKLVARRIGADTDTKREFEYTNWQAVDRFAEGFLDSLKLEG